MGVGKVGEQLSIYNYVSDYDPLLLDLKKTWFR